MDSQIPTPSEITTALTGASSPAPTKENIHQKFLRVMKNVSYIQKEKKPGMRYSIVSHDQVTDLIRPELVEVGIVYYPTELKVTQTLNRTEVLLTVAFVNADNPDDFILVPSLGYGIDDQDKGPGKAISYAVKYALLKAFGLSTGDDPDNDQDARHRYSQPATPAPQKSTLTVITTDSGDSVPYKDKTDSQKAAYWKKEWEAAPDESKFDALVLAFRSSEPEGSPVRMTLGDAYREQKARVMALTAAGQHA